MNHYFGTLPDSSCLFLDEHDLGERDGHAALMIFLISPNESVCTKKEGSGIKFYLLLAVVEAHPALLDHQRLGAHVPFTQLMLPPRTSELRQTLTQNYYLNLRLFLDFPRFPSNVPFLLQDPARMPCGISYQASVPSPHSVDSSICSCLA